MIPSDPSKVTVTRGERFSIDVEHEQNGALDAPVPVPASEAVTLLRRRGATIAYAADTLGRVKLIAHHTHFCIGIDPRIGSCTAFVVDVVR